MLSSYKYTEREWYFLKYIAYFVLKSQIYFRKSPIFRIFAIE